MADVKHFDPDAVLDTVLALFWRQGMASTGIQDLVTATRLSRSSLYAAFGGKRDLFLAALGRYVDRNSQPVLDQLGRDGRGLPAIQEFFHRLIDVRCFGTYANWGCMVSNTHAGEEAGDADVRRILDRHHDLLRQAMRAALRVAADRQQLRIDINPDTAADALALLAYGVNIRSRVGADAAHLRTTVVGVLTSISRSTDTSTSFSTAWPDHPTG